MFTKQNKDKEKVFKKKNIQMISSVYRSQATFVTISKNQLDNRKNINTVKLKKKTKGSIQLRSKN